MKNLVFLIFLILVYSCNKNEDETKINNKSATLTITANLEGEAGLSYEDSFTKWKDLKSKNSDSYIYQTRFISWTGYANITELKIEKGIITERNYEEYEEYWNVSNREIIDSYSEVNSGLGTHDKGAALLTIDNLYNSCSEYLSVDPITNTIYFNTETNGLMTFCGYNPKNCMDDCFIGINIISFIWI